MGDIDELAEFDRVRAQHDGTRRGKSPACQRSRAAMLSRGATRNHNFGPRVSRKPVSLAPVSILTDDSFHGVEEIPAPRKHK